MSTNSFGNQDMGEITFPIDKREWQSNAFDPTLFLLDRPKRITMQLSNFYDAIENRVTTEQERRDQYGMSSLRATKQIFNDVRCNEYDHRT